jgi:type II secretory pathway pseudopilin PulG
VRARLRNEEGFGLIELLISIVMLNVGILALVAAFNSSALAIQHASKTGTAAMLAEKQMELYRAQQYANVALDAALTNTASGSPGDATYKADVAWNATQETKICAGSPSSVAPQCAPTRTVTGPDGASYRVDTYIRLFTPTNGRAVRNVTVVVRNGTTMKTLARLLSTFDQATG